MYGEIRKIVDGKEIIIYHIFPPVPIREWDYQANFAKDYGEENCIYGEGATIEKAIEALLEREQDVILDT